MTIWKAGRQEARAAERKDGERVDLSMHSRDFQMAACAEWWEYGWSVDEVEYGVFVLTDDR